ncbi:hypothetical protein [Dokdonia sp. Dokd-P16]|uniref:hypothetical protein n=1 Tax=Dokdonia sp. Dokd-P16 TaxID=2173169 RepID=UPI0013A582C2|nr:hypothetical protein [Dokdonia sp. Dokd-P16]
MKLSKTYPLLLLIFLFSCKKEDKQTEYTYDKQYTADDLDYEDLFNEELASLNLANETNGEISIVNSYPDFTKKSKSIISKAEVESILDDSFQNEYLSKNDDQRKIDFFKVRNSKEDLSKLKLEFKELFYSDISKYAKDIRNNRIKDAYFISAFQFMSEANYGNVKDSILFNLNKEQPLKKNIQIQLVEILSQSDLMASLNYLSKILLEKNVDKNIRFPSKRTLIRYALSEDSTIQSDFSNLTLELFNKDIYSYNKVFILFDVIHRSELLNTEEWATLIPFLAKSNDDNIKNIGRKYEAFHLRKSFIENNKDINALDLLTILMGSQSENEVVRIKEYYTKNKKQIKTNNPENFNLFSHKIETYQKKHNSLDYFNGLFNSLGYTNSPKKDSLKHELIYESYLPYEREYPKQLLLDNFIDVNNICVVDYEAESGEFPNNYESILEKFSTCLKEKFSLELLYKQVVVYKNENKIDHYEIYLQLKNSNKTYKINLADTDDFYADKSIVQTINSILKDSTKRNRFLNISDDSASKRYLLIPPEHLAELNKSLNLNL